MKPPTEGESQSTHWEKQGRCPHCGSINGHIYPANPPLLEEGKKCHCGNCPEASRLNKNAVCPVIEFGCKCKSCIPDRSSLSHKTWEDSLMKQDFIQLLSTKDPIYGEENKRVIERLRLFISSLISDTERKILEQLREKIEERRKSIQDSCKDRPVLNGEAGFIYGLNYTLSLLTTTLDEMKE